MIREYIKTGKCIWCGRTKEDGASFNHVPHILPKALGGQETCTDVCNDCNSFFGDDRIKYAISQDEAVKGILQVGKHYFSKGIMGGIMGTGARFINMKYKIPK